MGIEYLLPPWGVRFIRVGGVEIARVWPANMAEFWAWSRFGGVDAPPDHTLTWRPGTWGYNKITNELIKPLGGLTVSSGGPRADGALISFAPASAKANGGRTYQPAIFGPNGETLKTGSAIDVNGGEDRQNVNPPRYCLASITAPAAHPEFQWGALHVGLV
jgi:hypothetical protein